MCSKLSTCDGAVNPLCVTGGIVKWTRRDRQVDTGHPFRMKETKETNAVRLYCFIFYYSL